MTRTVIPIFLRPLLILLTLTSVCYANTVRINEFMASNGSTIQDEDGDYEDWIELYNYGSEAVDLSGWGLSDDTDQPMRWTFAEGTVIEAGQYLLVWASGKDRPGVVAVPQPSEIDGLVLWMRASSVAGSDATAVNVWQDESGRGNDATQSSPDQQPTVLTNALNGRSALSFDRTTGQRLLLPRGDFDGLDDFTDFSMFQVVRWNGETTSGLWGGFRGDNDQNIGSSHFEITNVENGLARLRLSLPPEINLMSPHSVSMNNWHLVGATMNSQESRARVRMDGEMLIEGSGTVGQTLLSNYEEFPIGSSFDHRRTFGGEIAEVILFNRELTDSEVLDLEAYVAGRHTLSFSPDFQAHTNFRISASGEPLQLTRPDASVADAVPAVHVPRDISYGRDPNAPETWVYFYQPTPGEPNGTDGLPALLEPVSFSVPSGHYTSPFTLDLTHHDPEALILYTTDGSEPRWDALDGSTYAYMQSYSSGPLYEASTQTQVFEDPILVEDRSSEPNRISGISSTDGSNAGYLPDSPIKKGTAVRARAYRNGAHGEIHTATYFVSDSGAFDYGLPIISLSFTEGDLFDFLDGIYVAGIDHVTGSGGYICNFGNFNRRGREAERSAHLHYWENGELVLDQPAGIRIHGNCSRRRAFKSLRLYARGTSDEEDSFSFPFFSDTVPGALSPDNIDFDRLILRAPNFNDTVFSRLYQPVYEGVTGRIQPAIKFFNGEFWGLSLIRDRFDPQHLHHHYGLDPDNITIINIRYAHEVPADAPPGSGGRRYNVSSGIPSDMDDYMAMRAFVVGENMADPARYAEAEELLSIDSFIDHIILKIFAADDHYAPEFVFWRAREAESDGVGDGRWQVYIKDFDSTLRVDLGNLVEGLAEGTSGLRSWGNDMFASLLESPDFRHRFVNRFGDLLNTHFRSDRFAQIIHDTYNEISPYWDEVTERWNNTALSNPPKPFTLSQRNELLTYSQEQPDRQRLHIREYFNLRTEHLLTVHNSQVEKGQVRLNRITLDGETESFPWSGIYFRDVPVELEAKAEPGFRFVHWEIAPDGRSPSTVGTQTLSLSLSSDTSVEAVFEPIPLSDQPVGMHVWDFEDAENLLAPAFTLGGGALQVDPGPETEVLSNTGGDFDTRHLRINNPLGAEVRFSLPSAGYEALHLEYLTRRSGQGAGIQTLSYTLDGESWTELESYEVANDPPQPHSFDFSGIPEADNNSDFAVRITFSQGTGDTAGNNRFDDVVLSGIALPETNLPPVVAADLGLIALLEGSAPHEVDLEEVFSDPDGDPLSFQAHSSDESVAVVSVTEVMLDIEPAGRGGATLTVVADDSINPAVTHSFQVLVHPQAHALADGSFEWGEWSAGEPAGSYPAHMLFLQGDENDSSLTTALDYTYHIPPQDASRAEDADFPYAAEARTRINGLGLDGISFINTGRGRDLGGALLALDTRDVESAPVAWLAGTVQSNSREYALRLQYRVGIDSEWSDVLNEHDDPVEYVRSEMDGHVQPMEPVSLPQDALGKEYVQLLWRYYKVSGTSGARAQLRLDNLYVGNSDLDRTAVELVFAEHPVGHIQSGNPLPPITVTAVGPDGFIDPDYSGEIGIFVHSGAATLSGTMAADAVDGTAVFDDLSLQGLGAVELRAEAPELGSVVSTPVRVADITEELMPLYIQGDQDLQGDNNDRVPFAYRLSIEGLKPDSEYRFGNRVVMPQDPPEQDGAGNALIVTGADSEWVRNTDSPDFADEEYGARHWRFTTDAYGAYSGWFVTEPTGNSRFTPGYILRMRLLLNDGADGQETALMLTTSQHAIVLPFGEDSGQGSGIVGESDSPPRGFILLYDNTEGVGRPLAAAPVESTGAETDERYAAFYNEVVANTDGRWGSMIPNDLPEGVRRIEHRSFDGSISETKLRAEGYSGTVNPTTGLTPIFIDFEETDIPQFLPGGDGEWTSDFNWSTSVYPDGTGAKAYIGPAAPGNRTVTISETVTVGTLIIDNAGSEHRNRIEAVGEGVSLAFAGDETRLDLLGDGEGFVEFRSEAGITLADDLTVTVENLNLKHGVEGEFDDDYGALRLRDAWTGPGGLIKKGAGVMSLTGDGKDYQGETIINQGVLRVTEPAAPGNTSAVRVNSGGQLRLVSGGEDRRVYTFGGDLRLDSQGRGDDVPDSENLGRLGALRMDPGSNGNRSTVMNAIVMDGDSGIHVDGTDNEMELAGVVSGSGMISKSGGGRLVLSALSPDYGADISLSTGELHIDGSVGSDVFLGEDTLLSGSGSLGSVSGAGMVAPSSGAVLSADSAAGLSYRFSLERGTGGSILRLRGSAPFGGMLNPGNSIEIFLETTKPLAGDWYEGGFFTDADDDFITSIADAHWTFHVRDEAGTIEHDGKTYSEYGGEIDIELSTVAVDRDLGSEHVSGRVLRVLFDRSYDDWRTDQFDPEVWDDEQISGPLADPDGTGIRNLMRYALGLGRSDPYADRVLRIAASPPGTVRLIHHRLVHPGTNLQYQLQSRTDLDPEGIWEPVEIGVDLVQENIVLSEDGVTEKHEYSLPNHVLSPIRFYRLRIIMGD